MNLFKGFAEKIRDHVAEAVLTLAVLLLGPVAIWLLPKCSSWIDTNIPRGIQLRLFAFLCVTCFSLVLYIISLRRRLAKPTQVPDFLDDFEFVEKLGVYRHKTRAGYFCGSCTAKKILAPLRDAGHGWQCEIRECNKFHHNPSQPNPGAQTFRAGTPQMSRRRLELDEM